MKMPKKLFVGSISSPIFFVGHLAHLPRGNVAMRFFFLDQWIKGKSDLPPDEEW